MPIRSKVVYLWMLPLMALAACQPGAGVETPPAAATSTPSSRSVTEEVTPEAMSGDIIPTIATPPVGEIDRAALRIDFQSPGGRTLLSLVDVTNGAPLAGHEVLEFGSLGAYAYSPDFKSLAIVTVPHGESEANPSLLLLNLASWERREVALPLRGWTSAMALNHQGDRIAISSAGLEDNLTIVDTEQMAVVATATLAPQVRALAFSKNDRGLLVYSNNTDWDSGSTVGAPQAILLDTTDLSVVWHANLGGVRDGFYPGPYFDGQTHEPGAGTIYSPGVAFAPTGDFLYVAHADEDRLTRVDFESRQVRSMDIRPRLGFLHRLLSLGARVAHAKAQDGTIKSAVISKDGKVLYIVGMDTQLTMQDTGEYEIQQETLGLQVVEAATGTELANLDTPADQVAILPDDLVLLHTWTDGLPVSEVYDPAAKAITIRYDGLYQACVPLVAGSYVLGPYVIADYGPRPMQVFDPQNGRQLGSWEVPDPDSQWLSCTP